MKSRNTSIIVGILAFASLTASPIPNKPLRTLISPIDTVKVVVVYTLGEWNDTSHTYHHDQNTPLPGYA